MATGFFVMATSVYPFGLGPDPVRLAAVSPGLIWVTAIFAALLSLDRMFQADFEDGTLVQLMLSRLTPTATVIAKILAHWLAVMVPLILISPVMALILGMPGSAIWTLIAALLVGTPALSAFGAIAAALTVAVRRGGVLISLLLLPLFVPTLIFGAGAVDAAMATRDLAGPFLLLGGASLFALAMAPFAAAAALRLALE